jgi:pimeloyl-ACP methyl ester carboxylesterase
MSTAPIYTTVENEDCNLHYWFQGTGPLLIFIPGGNGHGRQYNAIMGLLASQYTVATLDRRQMSASQVKGPNKQFNPVQQARDIIAIMKALGHKTTSIFASSGGGIIAFQMAISYRETLDHVICHETPTTSLLSAEESTELMNFFFSLQDIYREGGVTPTMDAFVKKIMVGMEDGLPLQRPEPGNPINQFENEMIMGFYCPDLMRLLENGTSVAVGFGKKSEGAIYKKTALEQAKRLGCEVVEFPGHHQGFESQPEEFAPVLVALLGRMEERRRVRREGCSRYHWK